MSNTNITEAVVSGSNEQTTKARDIIFFTHWHKEAGLKIK